MATVDEILTRQAYAAGDGAWTKDNNYPSYTLYVEPEYVPVTNKRIADFNDQISVRGEQNAQFVGFQMPRYDDGLDLTAAHLYIHYQTVYGGSDSVPCNVSWTDNYIRLCWQVPAQATQEPDRVQMMIYATGTNSAGERVTWKTLPASYTIHDGLDIGGGIPEPDPSWYEQFVAQMEGKVSIAQGYANDAQASKTAAAGSAAESAQSAAASAKALEDNRAYVESQKETFAGYNKRETDLKYANALIGTASGMGRVTVGDAWEAPIPDLEIAGMSGQFSTTGAQMLDIPSLSARTSNGVTFTPNPDGAILAAGTATGGNSTFYLSDRLSVPSGDYYISGCPDGGDKSTYVIKGYINTSDGTSYAYAYDIGDGDTLTVKDGQTLSLAITIGNNASGPLVFRPMLHAGSTPKPWEPYTGCKPSPSPEYPQPIISTGTVSTGAQMFDASKIPSKSARGATVTNNGDGSFTVSGSGNLTEEYFYRYKYSREETLKLIKPGKYAMTFSTVYPLMDFIIQGTGVTKAIRTSTNASIEITDADLAVEDVYLTIDVYGQLGKTIVPGTIKPMVWAKESIPTDIDWEPYTGGKPSPSPDYPQTMDVTVTGAQLFDASLLKSATSLGIKFTNNGDGSFTVDGTATGYANMSYPISLPPETYSVSGGKNQIKFFVRISKDGLTYTDHSNSFTINGDEAWVRVFIQISPNLTVSETIWPMLNAGPTALPWQPYQSSTAAITLTEPLCGIGDVRDRIMCRDGVWGVERQFVSLTFDGSENWIASNTGYTNKNRFWFGGYENVIRHETNSDVGIKILCDKLPGESSGDTYRCIDGISSNMVGRIMVYLDDFSSGDVSAFKTYLSTHPISAIFELAIPAWTPLPSETQSALNALTTYTGTTHVTITAGGPEPDVGLGYVQDTRAVVADLQAQINAIRNGGAT